MDEQTNNNVAYIIAMAVGGLIEAMGMYSENQHRLQRGETIAYNDEAFIKLMEDRGLYHNAILSNMRYK